MIARAGRGPAPDDAKTGDEREGATVDVDDGPDPEDRSLDRDAAEEAGAAPSPSRSKAKRAEGANGESPVLAGAELRRVIEAILFASSGPVALRRLVKMLPEAKRAEISDQLLALEADLVSTPRGFSLVEEGGGYRLLTRPDLAPFVARLRGENRRVRLSKAAFETLAVIAYRQPMRKADLDAIRGVNCGAIIKNLMEWDLVRVVGREESIGRPLLYGTTESFLDQFGIPTLENLPDPREFMELGDGFAVEVVGPDEPPVVAEIVTDRSESGAVEAAGPEPDSA